MKDLNSNTKKAQAMLQNYYESVWHNIFDAYGRLSQRKFNAWKDCIELMEEHNGRGLKVCAKSTCFFAAGFRYTGEDENGVEHDYIVYITKNETYRIKVN